MAVQQATAVVRNDVRAVVANAAANFSAVRLGQLWSLILFVVGFTAATPLPNQGFPARFLVREPCPKCGKPW